MKIDSKTRVDHTLSQTQAIRLDQTVLNQDLSLARWCNQRDRVQYQKVGHHTFSLYLHGGLNTYRSDRPDLSGAPGRICLMPAGQDSTWEVAGPLEFVHLYFSEESFKQFALSSRDLDPRRVELVDVAYAEDPQLQRLALTGLLAADWHDPSQRLQLQSGGLALMDYLLDHYVSLRKPQHAYIGGLSTSSQRAAIDFMQAHLHADLSLEQIAAAAALSPYHFARMFKLSLGVPPHQYLTQLRVQRAQQLLGQGLELADIALACGFAHQSHFTRAFKRLVGVTPGAYRQLQGD